MGFRSRAYSKVTLCLLVGLLSGLAVGAEPPVQTLRILSRTPLPAGKSLAEDIRWASADSVYVVHGKDGVFEVGLDGTVRRSMVTSFGRRPGPFFHLAVSDQNLVVASMSQTVAWRPIKSESDGKFRLEVQGFDLTDAMDAQNDRILLFGLRENIYHEGVQSNGEVAWIGSLSAGLKDLKPVYFDRSGPKLPQYSNCSGARIGAVRFLADGSYVIVPGFEKGVHLYSAKGKLQRSWTSEQVGLDTDCSGATTQQEALERKTKPAVHERWLNGVHAVDAVLPLAQGPGLLVRSWGEDGKAHWNLKILSGSRVETYAVPFTGSRPTDRLHGDVRDGKIVLLLSASGFNGPPAAGDPQGEIMLLEVPN